jgi:AraC family transcriptional regulator, regulatory protein of adaptative response / methylated-DNA-[protein]-cysteine methyltransferase
LSIEKVMATVNHAVVIQSDPRWAQLVARDASANGQFFYSVKTTGVYCRPSCGARTPLPKNVAFHESIARAEAAGFRACKRCKPGGDALDVQQARRIAEACRQIQSAEIMPTLGELAKAADMSAFYFHRLFKSITGVTPKAFALAEQSQRMRKALLPELSVTDAIYEAGFSSSARFYEKSKQMLGMSATRYRQGGAQEQIRFAIGACSLGAILVAQSAQGVCAILLGDAPEPLLENLQARFPKAQLIGADTDFEALVAQVVGLVEAPQIGLQLPLDVRGSAFQQRVWQALRTIPVGVRLSYSELAQRIGQPKAVRAVASACAANNIAIAIPCHRIVRGDGSLSGYAWGVQRKQLLLAREQAQE